MGQLQKVQEWLFCLLPPIAAYELFESMEQGIFKLLCQLFCFLPRIMRRSGSLGFPSKKPLRGSALLWLLAGPSRHCLGRIKTKVYFIPWERSGSVVECLTRDREAAGSSITGVTALWSLSKTHIS